VASYLPIDRSPSQIALDLSGVKPYLSIERGGARQETIRADEVIE
jgi:hypothetical protein